MATSTPYSNIGLKGKSLGQQILREKLVRIEKEKQISKERVEMFTITLFTLLLSLH